MSCNELFRCARRNGHSFVSITAPDYNRDACEGSNLQRSASLQQLESRDVDDVRVLSDGQLQRCLSDSILLGSASIGAAQLGLAMLGFAPPHLALDQIR